MGSSTADTRPADGTHGEGQTTAGRLREALALGAVGGLFATVVMTAFREPISRSPPPTANFWAQYVAPRLRDTSSSDEESAGAGDPGDYFLPGLVLHLAYGTGAAVAFAALFRPAGSEAANERRGVLWGVGYALLLSGFGKRVLLERLLGMDLDRDERFVFHVSHVVYGLALGTWVGSNAPASDS